MDRPFSSHWHLGTPLVVIVVVVTNICPASSFVLYPLGPAVPADPEMVCRTFQPPNKRQFTSFMIYIFPFFIHHLLGCFFYPFPFFSHSSLHLGLSLLDPHKLHRVQSLHLICRSGLTCVLEWHGSSPPTHDHRFEQAPSAWA